MQAEKEESQQREYEINTAIAVANKYGVQGLLESLLFRDAAITYLISSRTPEAKELKHSLCAILSGENPLQQDKITNVTPENKSQLPNVAEFPLYIQPTPLDEQQMLAMRYLSKLVNVDSQIYKTFLAVARGTRSSSPKVAYAALEALAQCDAKVKDELKKVASDAVVPEDLRITAYAALALSGLLNSQKTLDFVCALATDDSIIRQYETKGKLSPNAMFLYNQEAHSTKPTQRFSTPQIVEDIRLISVERAQKEFQEQLLGVVGCVLKLRAIDVLAYATQSVSFAELTPKLCELSLRNPALGIPVLCEYATSITLSIPQLIKVHTTLEMLTDKAQSLGYGRLLDRTIRDIAQV